MSPYAMVERLLRATNDHDVDAVVACFAEGYVNDTPVHPARGFRGREQVRRNWQQVFAAVADLRAEVVRRSVDGDVVWSEWEMRGTRADGSAHHLRGVIVFGVDAEVATWARFYLEPVDDAPTGVDAAVREQVLPVILVAGGSGRLGTALVRLLVDAGRAVRVLTRDPRRAAHLADLPVEIVQGDVRSPATLRPALAGVETTVSAVHGFAGPGRGSPRSVDRDGNTHLIDAAAAQDTAVVLVSVIGAGPDAAMPLFRAKYAAEQHLRASGVPWTIVRAAAFLETWATILATPVVPGRGDNPITFISVTDVAALVRDVVLEPRLRGLVLDAAGPDDLTLNELAAAVQRSSGRSRTVVHVPRAVLRAASVFSRKAQAAVVMDTTDMTIDRADRGDRAGPGVTAAATDVVSALHALHSRAR